MKILALTYVVTSVAFAIPLQAINEKKIDIDDIIDMNNATKSSSEVKINEGEISEKIARQLKERLDTLVEETANETITETENSKEEKDPNQAEQKKVSNEPFQSRARLDNNKENQGIITVYDDYKDKDKDLQELERLEKEKKELMSSIDVAIRDSIKILQNSNDTDALAEISYVKDLRRYMNELNASDVNNTDTESRRKLYVDNDVGGEARDAFKVDNIFGSKKSKHYQDRLVNRLKVKQQIDSWLEQREEEKKKILNYKKQQQQKRTTKPEPCPEEGFKRSRRAGAKPKTGDYPCCRKCCKRSYMGCL